MLLNPGARAPLGGEFEKLRGETLKRGELGVNYTQRGEVVIGQIICCQLYNAGLLSFQIVIYDKVNKASTKYKNSC